MYSDQSKFAEHLHMFSTTYFKVSCNVVKYILNGPNLLSKITKWARHQTFKSRVKQSFKCVMKHYRNYRVVMFDGYQQTPTAKDYLHTERTQDVIAGPDVQLKATSKLAMKKTNLP